MSRPTSSATIEFPARCIDAEIKKELDGRGITFKESDPLEIEEVTGDMDPEIFDGIFRLNDGEAAYGGFEDLEALLVEKGIPFDRTSYQDWQCPPVLRVFRVIGNDPFDVVINLDADGDVPVVSVPAIRKIIAARITDKTTLRAIGNYLDELVPSYPPLADYVTEADHA